MRSIRIRYSANNEVSVQLNDLPYPKRNYGDKEADRQSERFARTTVKSHEDYLRDNSLMEHRDSDGTLWHYDTKKKLAENPNLSNLTLSANLKKNYEKKRSEFGVPGWGVHPRPTVFGRNARHRILECGGAFDQVLRESHTGSFVTLTLPGSSERALDAISLYSGYLLNLVLQVIRDNFSAPYFFGVWELQERGALHLHLFIAVPKNEYCYGTLDKIRQAWYRAMEVLQDTRGVDFFTHKEGEFCTTREYWQADIQNVEQSPASYFAKYVGKQANAPSRRGQQTGNKVRYPSRWWCCSRNFKQLTDSMRFDVSIDAIDAKTANELFDAFNSFASDLEAHTTYYRDGQITSSGDPRRVLGSFAKYVYFFSPDMLGCVQFLVKKWVREVLACLVPVKTRWRYHPFTFEDTPIDSYLPASVYL